MPTPRRPSPRIHDKGYPRKPPFALLQSPPRTFMVSWGLLAKTVNASQSIERVNAESMEPIELLYGALWVAPPCYQDGGHSAPPRSLSACGADRLCLPTTDDSVALNRAPIGVSSRPCDRSGACSDLMQTPPHSKEPSRGQEGSRGDKSRTDYRTAVGGKEVSIRTRMCAFVRSERQL